MLRRALGDAWALIKGYRNRRGEIDYLLGDHARSRKTLNKAVEQCTEVGDARYESGRFAAAAELFDRLSTAPKFEEFLTIPAYEALTRSEAQT